MEEECLNVDDDESWSDAVEPVSLQSVHTIVALMRKLETLVIKYNVNETIFQLRGAQRAFQIQEEMKPHFSDRSWLEKWYQTSAMFFILYSYNLVCVQLWFCFVLYYV